MTTYKILGYIFTIFNYIFYCTSRFGRKKQKMLSLDLLAKASTFTALYFLGSLSGAYSMFMSFIILISANIKVRKGKTWTPLYVLFEVGLVLILILKFEGLSSVLVFLTSSVSLLSIWWLKPQGMRIASFFTSFSSLLYQLSIRNYAGLLELVVISSNILSYIKYLREEKRKA